MITSVSCRAPAGTGACRFAKPVRIAPVPWAARAQRLAPRRLRPVAALDAGPTGLPPRRRTSDTRLGEVFLHLLPGQLYFLPALLYPLATVLAGVGAVWGPAIVQWVAGLPLVQALGPLSPLLLQLSTTQPWASLLAVLLSLLTAYMAFIAMPLLDFLLGRDLRNPTEEEAVELAKNAMYRCLLYVYCPLHIGMLLGMCHLLSTSATLPLAFAGATISAGVAGGIMFITAHELLHGSAWLDKAAASALLAFSGYMHWTESHLAHHVKVATVEDPASARTGESLYRFIPRSIWGNLVDGYGTEAKRLKRKGIPLLSLQNKMMWWVGCPLALLSATFTLYGWAGLCFALGQAVISILMLEAVNYIEHYGLQRAKLPNGRYERVGPQHSWNCSFMATSAASFKLQRHADHHMFGSKAFHLLNDIPAPDAPQLPVSYPAAVMLALVPPMYFKVMDGQVAAYKVSRQGLAAAAATAAQVEC